MLSVLAFATMLNSLLELQVAVKTRWNLIKKLSWDVSFKANIGVQQSFDGLSFFDSYFHSVILTFSQTNWHTRIFHWWMASPDLYLLHTPPQRLD